ncbi:type ISP restriction/modification enzyme [Campylobacter upsaliensis]|uniref:type ISP restriction/modification enzyme n=1 Tax=Campylobacter upsaliensis TaxID=28080 RepID=UPI0029BE1034|nr:type ISP restriction/modification enzyme [Campylobacter upsaliensis]EJP4246748.1 N-6 DNA methylase [Campylobacter upsaliensis]EJX8727923.1 N-6 DNA methylase [Campylobacter upsaliensis]ELW3219793.1 N-6 DNA methylase [Campylobacter upsaliensis]MEB2808878.1 type ISP restriction/modification enzyme [Campylobacter upsaliensis]MEB2827881.1 type ISP restriction/modification enzyme [Campylobacter upsaliensis]
MEEFKKYINEIQKIFQAKNYNEHSFRTPFENLLNALKPKEIKIIHEPKSEKGQGSIRPDFKVYKLVDKEKELSYNHLIGFIECKNLDVDLDKEFKSEQLLRYSQISPNIIFTNYKRFMLLSFEKIIIDINLLDDDLNLIEKNINIFKNLIQVFFDDNSTTIKTKQELVKVLSSQSFYLSNALKSSSSQSDSNSSFNSFFQRTKDTFKSIEKIELKDEEFCDILAQAVVYGIFVSYIENDDYDLEKIPIENFISFLPSTFRTLSEFVYFSVPSFSLPQDIKYTLENIKKTLALIDKVELCNILNQDLESISIYLYEDFLKAFDELRATQKRKEGGVFYTPKSVVKMIVSSLDELLKSKFNKTGFNDKSVKVLDFATGTGSFLAAVFEKIISKESEIFKNETIKNKFLKDIYGFELSFVPYIVARLKLGQILRKSGFKDFSEADFQIYLNNTLDLEKNANFDMFMPLVNLDQEWQKARDVKHDKNLLVILGNPPYNAKSKNKGKEILELLKIYKENLNETNIQPLDDDYIKFMRFAQWKLLEQGQKNIFEANSGLMGFITNNSFLDGRIHRKMRESLFTSFDEIYILNLHGSDKDAKNDENVFDIKIGVCISLFIKYKNEPSKGATIFYASTAQKGIFKRAEKYALLDDMAQRGLNSIKWEELSLDEPYFWFVPKSFDNAEYEEFWALAGDKALAKSKAVFLNFNSGVETGKDNIAIQPSKSAMEQVLSDFETLSKEAILKKYKLKDLDENIISKTLAEYKHKDTPARITPIAYRPFDTQYTLYSRKQGFLRRTMYGVMQHFLRGENLGLCFPKICLNFIFDYSMVINTIVDRTFGGSKTGSETCIAPLYSYDIDGKIPNFTPEFLAYKAKHKILKDKNEEQILAFIYANLYNPKYRSKYLDYLKIGFPKVSFEVSVKEFERFEKLGSELIKLHLMQEIPQDEIDFIFLKESKKPNFKIAKYQEKERFVENKIILNEDLAISPIGAEIWNYTIGGYQVLKQWLKYRKDYVCTKEELEHLLKICKILKKTIEIQGKLSEV